MCNEQPRSAWCVTRCVRTQDVGALAQTSASPAETSAVDELVWIAAIFTMGESEHLVLMSYHHHSSRWFEVKDSILAQLLT